MKKLLLIIFVLAISASYAQPWMQKFENQENPNFFEIEKEFNNYWIGKNYQEKGSGWKLFKRWIEFWRPRVDSNGEFPKINNEFFALRDLQKQNKSNSLQSAASWNILGPTTSTGGYGGIGRINCVRVNQSNGHIWAGAAAGGLWKSTNSGVTWTTVTDNISIINSLGVSDIAIHPTNSNIMYIATGDMDGGNTRSIGVMKSTDGGSTWATTGLSFTVNQGRYIGRLLIDPSNTNVILAAGNAGTYRSADAGSTWTTTSSNNVKDMEFYPGNSAIVYTSGSKFYRSTNNGQTWTQITSGLANDIQRASIAVSPANPDYVYVLATNNSSYFKALYRSTDGGLNFTTQSTTPNIMGYELNGSGTGGQGWYDNCIAVNPNNVNEVYVGGINIWKSTNGGVNWTIKTFWYFQNGYAEVHADQHDLYFDNSTGYLYAGNDGGVYRTTNNGTNWSYINSTMPITQFYKISTSKVSTPVTIGGAQDNGTKLSYNGTWTDEIGGDGMECIVSHSNSQVIYGSLYYGNIQKSTNGGSSFRKINDMDGNNNYDQINETGNWVTPYMLAPNDANTLYVGMTNLWKSTDAGNTFAKITNYTGSRIAIIAISASDPNYIYNSTGSNLRYTNDGGDTWNTAVKPGGNNLTYLIVDKLNPLKLYATVSGYTNNDKAYTSIDGGMTWTNISAGLPNVPANCIYETDLPTNRFFAGTDIGVYRYNDLTATWENFSNGMPSVIVNELDQQKPSNRLMAGTYARGIYYFDLNSLLNVVGSPSLVYPANLDRGRLRDTIRFSWSTVPGAISYNLQISTSNSFTSGNLINQYNINTPQYNASQIDTGVVYYWRVKAYSGTDSSAWSSVNTFTTKLKVPYQIYPSQNANAIPLAGNFIVSPISNTEVYNVFLNEIGNNGNSATLTSASASISFSSLKQGTRYSWTVAGYLNNYSGYESNSQTFTTILNSVNLTFPTNSSKALNNSVTFSWTPNTFATKYVIQVSKDSDLSNIIQSDTVASITQYNMNELEYYTKYYWRVKAINNVTESAWSSISSFTTKIQPTLLIQPSNNVYLNKKSIDFLWTDRLSASKYLLQIAKDSTFGTIDYTSSTFSTLLTFKNFEPNVTYAWRVRSINGTDSSDWSPFWRFTTYLDKIKLITPNDKSENIETKDVKLIWNKLPFANAYKVYFSDSQPFDTTKFIQTTDTFLVPNNVAMNKKYYWSVIGFNTNNQSDSLETFSFTTTADRPVLTVPTNLSKNLNKDNLVFTWTSLSNVTIYELVYSDNIDFSGGKPSTDTIKTNIASQAANFTTGFGKKYYWKVRALINGVYTNWSETWEFKTALEVVKQEMPVDKSVDLALKPTMKWKSTSSPFYQVNVSEFAGFNQFDEYNLSTLELNITDKKLKPQTTYYWRVRAIFPDDTSSWSETWSFSTYKPKSILISPLNNLKQQEFVQNLVWETSPDFESYKVDVAKDSNFSNIVETATKTGNTHTTKALELETRYFWRVIGNVGNLITINSETWNFTTKDLNSVKEDKTKFFISPNPVNNYLNLNLLVNDDADWQYEILDISSKLVLIGKVKSGSTVIDLQGLANGKYFIKATNGKLIYSDKFDVSK